MDKTKNNKKKVLIVLAVIAILGVFLFAGCMGKSINSTNDDYYTDYIPDESFAIINISGTIQASPDSPLDRVSYDHSSIMNYIDELIEDNSNHGILLRVDSGGGTVYHSDEMYLKLMEYKEKTGRPIQAYFLGTAASGAYYISCAADHISANRNCWTGSIGVIISYTNYKGLYDKLGLEEIIIASGDNKGMGSSAGTLTDEQRAIYQSLVDESYERFVDIVSLGRNMDTEYVKQLADGRIYTAAQALDNGLIDEICSYEDAVREMELTTGAVGYVKYFYKDISILDYLLLQVKDVMPKSDLQKLDEMMSSDLNGIPLYYMRQ